MPILLAAMGSLLTVNEPVLVAGEKGARRTGHVGIAVNGIDDPHVLARPRDLDVGVALVLQLRR